MNLKTTWLACAAMMMWATCAVASGSAAAAHQTVRLEVAPAIEAFLWSLSERSSAPLELDEGKSGRPGTAEVSLTVAPCGFRPKVTVSPEAGAAVELSVEVEAEGGRYPAAGVRLTLTDP